MSQTAYIAIILALVSAIIAPAIKKYFFDPRMRLIAEVRVWRSKTKNAVARRLNEALAKDDTSQASLLKSGNIDSSYIELRLRNLSTKKLQNVSVTSKGFLSGSYQIGDAEELLKLQNDVAINVGDIMPRHDRMLHIWSVLDLAGVSFSFLKGSFEISADEIDTVRIRYPLPGYLHNRYHDNFSPFVIGIGSGLAFLAISLLAKLVISQLYSG
jgi:hypothetical protein